MHTHSFWFFVLFSCPYQFTETELQMCSADDGYDSIGNKWIFSSSLYLSVARRKSRRLQSMRIPAKFDLEKSFSNSDEISARNSIKLAVIAFFLSAPLEILMA